MSSSKKVFPIENRLLATLPRDEYERLLPKLELTQFPRNRILYEAGDETRYAYFPNSGVASLLAITEDGRTIEIGSVGNEGFIGVPIVHEVGTAHYRVIVQMPVEAVRIEPHLLLAEIHRGGKLHELLYAARSRPTARTDQNPASLTISGFLPYAAGVR